MTYHKTIVSLIYIFMIVSIFKLGYYFGSESKMKVINEYKERNYKITNDIRRMEYNHKQIENALTKDLAKLRIEYEENIINLTSDYDDRLRKSDERANTYQREASSGSNCTALANHTSKLDRSLEEGRSLVKELREVVRLQERQLDYCIKVIENDRELLK